MVKKERVQKIISNRGYCSRRKAEALIEAGKVRVDGKRIAIGESASPDALIMVGNSIVEAEAKAYFLLNKPPGYECTLKGKRTIMSLLPGDQRLFPVGRLDKNARGLVIATNDGDFAQKLLHPRYEKDRTYVLQVDKPVAAKDIAALNKGVRLKDGKVQAKAKPTGKKQLRLTLHVGKKHIVKRLLFKLGYYVRDLKRVSMGPITLDVPEGKTRPLTKQEIQAVLR